MPYLVASFLTKYGIEPTQYIDRASLAVAMPRAELYALLLSWIREHNVLTNAEGKIYKIDGRRVTLKQKGELSAYTLPAGIPIFRKLGDRYQEYANVPVLIGDRMTVILSPGKLPVAAIVQANFDGASFDRTSSFANWTRSYRADELVPAINRRQPITQLVDIRPVTVDASKRVAELEVTAEGGRKFMLRGLPIRWSLNVPDNLFVYDKTRDPRRRRPLHLLRKGLGPRHRYVPGRRLRHGLPRLDFRPHSRALLHRSVRHAHGVTRRARALPSSAFGTFSPRARGEKADKLALREIGQPSPLRRGEKVPKADEGSPLWQERHSWPTVRGRG